MAGKTFAELKVGDRFESPSKTITESAETTPLGWQAAPGRMTLMMMGGLEEQTEIFSESSLLSGFKEVRFKAPVLAGDTIEIEMEIIEKRETSRPGQGLVIHKSVCKNQRGEVVMEVENVHVVYYRQ